MIILCSPLDNHTNFPPYVVLHFQIFRHQFWNTIILTNYGKILVYLKYFKDTIVNYFY